MDTKTSGPPDVPAAAQPPPVQTYSKLASAYDDVRFVGATNQLKESFRTKALVSLLPGRSHRVLDVACGTGRGLVVLKEHAEQAVGVDGTHEMLLTASRKLRVGDTMPSLCRANAGALPFADELFDAVTCLNFLHLFGDAAAKQRFLAEIARVLRPGGTAVVEFDNALHGVLLGPIRKYFGRDIGYEWPWALPGYFGPDLKVRQVVGTNVPGIWRFRFLHVLEDAARGFPVNYLASRLLVRAVKS